MKRFFFALLCMALLACAAPFAFAEEATKDMKSENAQQCQQEDEQKKEDGQKEEGQKEEGQKEEAKQDEATEEAPKEEPPKEEVKEEPESKEEVKKEDDVKKDEKEDEAKKAEADKKAAEEKEAKEKEPKTVEVKKDEIHLCVEMKGIFEARKSESIKLDPKQWGSFKVLRAVDHGKKVSRGDLLVAFDPEEIDRAIADGRQALEIARLNLKKSEKEFATFEKILPMDEEAMARAVQELIEDQKWEDEHDRKLVEADLEMSYESAKFRVESAREEYNQLKKMYEADDLTEETEEIILKRTKLELDQAEHYFKYSQARYDFAKSFGLDRFKRRYDEQKIRDKISTEQAVALFPLSVELKKIEMEKGRIEFERAKEKFEELQADRKLMTLKAPCDGIVYYGACTKGKWSGSSSDMLEEDKTVAPKKVFMTIVNTESLQVCSEVSEKELLLIREGMQVTARAIAMPETQLQLVVDEVVTIPSGSSFDIVLKTVGNLPEAIVPGMSCAIKAIVYHKEDALVIPPTAIETDPLDDAKLFVYRVDKEGKPEKVAIQKGKAVEKKVEILSGLAEGDKILPEPPKDEEK